MKSGADRFSLQMVTPPARGAGAQEQNLIQKESSISDIQSDASSISVFEDTDQQAHSSGTSGADRLEERFQAISKVIDADISKITPNMKNLPPIEDLGSLPRQIKEKELQVPIQRQIISEIIQRREKKSQISEEINNTENKAQDELIAVEVQTNEEIKSIRKTAFEKLKSDISRLEPSASDVLRSYISSILRSVEFQLSNKERPTSEENIHEMAYKAFLDSLPFFINDVNRASAGKDENQRQARK